MNRFCICMLFALSVLGSFTLNLQDGDAYHAQSGAYTTAQNNWFTTCTNLERAISHLENLDSKAGDIEVEINVNNEELRDQLLATPQYYSADVISAWASALSAAVLTGFDIYDGILLHKALTRTAGAINKQMDKIGTETDVPALTENNEPAPPDDASFSYFARRKAAYNELVKQTNLHNAGHSGDDIGLPTQPETTHEVERRTPPPPQDYYSCLGSCGDEGPRYWSNTFIRWIGMESHFTRCDVVMHNNFGTYLVHGNKIKCGAYYYSCEGRFVCPNAHNHPGGISGEHTHGVSVRASDHRHKHPHDFWGNPIQEDANDDDDDDDSTEQDMEGLQTEQTQTSTPSYHPCGVHATSVSGTHSAAGCGVSGHYSCDSSDHTAASCGVSGHYSCDGSDHSLQASCTTTNASGQYCTVSSFYACQSHTHAYPPPPITYACGIHSGDPSNSSEHVQVTGGCGHTYYKCQFLNGQHYRSRCSSRSRNGGRLIRCTVRYWRCQYPNGDGHTHTYGR